jgi:SAM-dependent methyltransferase
VNRRLYDRLGIGYSNYRRPDRRIAAEIDAALGSAHTVVNFGAGTGSYEPTDRVVTAVEPSAEMIRQRARSAARAVRASAERLPFRDQSFDAALAILTIHHWASWRQGLRELRRVARDRIVILTWNPEHAGFWLVQDYFPEVLEIDRLMSPQLDEIARMVGRYEVRTVLIPGDCSDGFLGAYWRRPAMYLDDGARRAISTFSKLKDIDSGLKRLQSDLADGTWERRYGSLQELTQLDIGYRLIVADRR